MAGDPIEAFIKVFLPIITVFYAISLRSTYSLRACLHGGRAAPANQATLGELTFYTFL